MPAKRIFNPRSRGSGFRDAKLVVIATEGTRTEKIYFDDLAKRYRRSDIHIETLTRQSTASSPKSVLAELDNFRRHYSIRRGYDELWLVVDKDRWGEEMLSQVIAQCEQKGYKRAVSNPCFELWLLLHVADWSSYTSEVLDEFRINRKTGERTRLEIELVNILGSYNKSNPDTQRIIPHVQNAIRLARGLDLHPEHRWSNGLGTRVYLLAETIIRQD